MTNMCNDQDCISVKSSVSINPEVAVSGSWGELKYLGTVDPKNFDVQTSEPFDVDDISLHEGENDFPLTVDILHDSEVAIKLKYTTYSKVGSISEPKSWFYFQASRYCSVLNFSLINNLKSKKDIKFAVQRKNLDGSSKLPADGSTLKFKKNFQYVTETSLLAGNYISFYLFNQ